MILKINQSELYDAQDGYFGVMNLGGFSAAIYASYKYNGEFFSFNSGLITLFLYKEIKIPAGATDIHLYALIGNGLAQWTPVYNNNFSSSGIVELKLGGTIFSPYATILTEPDKSKSKILATNNGAFITRYTLGYNFNGYIYDMESQNFSLGMSREIAIPNLATNISINAEYYTGIDWVTLYNNNISTPKNVELTFSGTTSNPSYTEKITPPLSGGNGTVTKKAILMCSKKSHKNVINLNDTVTFAIYIANPTSTPATNIMLQENLSSSLQFIPKSFKINGIAIENISSMDSPIKLSDIQMNSSILVTYKVKVISIPTINPIMDIPTLLFNYIDENNTLQNSTSTGSVIPLLVGTKPTNPCCHCMC